MKVCYFIQTHKNPEQIYRLVRTIKKSSPKSQILIGHDFTSSDLDITPLQDLSDVHLLKTNSRPLRGDFSLIQPYLDAIDWLFENSNFEWLIYLSGQDYPTQSLSQLENFLAQTEYDGFIRYWNVFSDDCPWDKEKVFKRYFCKYWRLPGRYTYNWLLKIQKLWFIKKFTPLQFFLTYGPLVGIPYKSTPFNNEFLCYGGRQWHTLSRKCVEYIRKFIQNHPDIVKYYQQTVCSDESFIQTILANNQEFKLCKEDKRFIEIAKDWGGHPRILTKQDYTTLTNGNYHFARKFDPKQDAEILDMLDTVISSY